jgi:very-short-patch-repair endonuclease
MPSDGEKLTKSTPLKAVGAEIPRQEEFVARLVSLDAICALSHRTNAAGRTPDADRVASWIAGQQLALITTAQLDACGLGRNAIAGRVRRGLLHRVHQGVYLFGARAFPPGTREFAAILACGSAALITHRSAAALYGLTTRLDARLRAELDRAGGPAWTRSEAERRMKLLLRQAGLPSPLTNRKIAGYQADFVWPAQRLIVEVDGYQFHGHRRAFERDRKRDAAHVLAGYRVIRVTWRRLADEPMAVAVMIGQALAMPA